MPRNARPVRDQRFGYRWVVGLLAAVALLGSGAAVVSASSAGAATTQNLVRDPSFRYGASAWTVTKGTRVWVTSYGHAGHRALGIRNLYSYPRNITLNDRRNTIARTTAGRLYTASAWVRIAQRRTTAAIRQGAWRGSTADGSPALRSAWLADHGWHQIRVAFRAVRSSDAIDLNILAWKLPPRASFYISQISLVASISPAPRPSSTAPTTPAPSTSSDSATPAPPTSSDPTTPPTSSDPTTPPTSSDPAPSPSSSSSSTITSPSSIFKRLTFDDEFDGTTLDTSKWNVNQYQLPYEMSESLASNVSVRDSDLVIPAIRETSPHGRPWTSAYIDTRHGKFSQKYGRFEARIKINTTADNSSGLWPAFWLRPDNTAYTGEIDIMEAWGEKSTGYTSQVYPAGGAFTSFLADTNHADNRKQTVTLRPAPGTRLSDGFHTYALEWTPTTMAVYLDNVQVGPTLDPTSMPWWNNYDTPFHIRLQMQVGQLLHSYPDLTPGYWGTPTSNTISYSAMLVDWVRVWGQ